MMTKAERMIVRAFQQLYYDGLSWHGKIYDHTTWMGVPCLKCPLDLWAYQEIVFDVKPDVILETGTYLGGSALYLAHLCELMGHGRIVTIDIEERPRPSHERITYVTGSSTDPATLDHALASVSERHSILVILDSDHSEAHVTRELALLAPLVTLNSYIIVEDTNINGHPVHPGAGPGPFEAVQKFVAHHPDFHIDESREKFLLTFNPQGYLKRVARSGQTVTPITTDLVRKHHAWTDTLGDDVQPAMDAAQHHHRLALAITLLDAREQQLVQIQQHLAQTQQQFNQVSVGFAQAMEQLTQLHTMLGQISADLARTLAMLQERDRQLAEANQYRDEIQSVLAAREAELTRLRSHWLWRIVHRLTSLVPTRRHTSM
jgi:cephalosporin hydroxylase